MLRLQTPHTFHRRIRIVPGIFRQKLVGQQFTLWRQGDDIGKGTAAVNPELPIGMGRVGWHSKITTADKRAAYLTSAAVWLHPASRSCRRVSTDPAE